MARGEKVRVVLNAPVCKRPCVGAVMKDKDGDFVYIEDGYFEISGRISNWWAWRKVREDGTLGRKKQGYAWEI